MTVPRVLLLTGITPPGAPMAAGHFLRDLCLSYPRDSICCFCITKPEWAQVPKELDWLPISYGIQPRERGIMFLPTYLMNLSAFLYWHYLKLVHARTMVTRAVKFGREHHVDVVVAILNTPTQIHNAPIIASKLGARLVAIVWDPPEFLSTAGGFDCYSRRSLLREFKKVLQRTDKCGVASEVMAEEYKNQYGIEPVVLIHSIHPDNMRPPAKEINSDKKFIIGFGGNLYARDEWQALLSALSEVNWQIEGHDVIVRVLCNTITFRAPSGMQIEYLGWRPLDESIEIMSQVDVAYLPYWFDKKYSLSVRLCFPNKLASYLAAGRPVLFHGPEVSSPARFLRRFPAGLCCHSLDHTKIIDSLRRFITDKEFYASATQAGQLALDQELNLHVFRRRFATLLGIEETDLLPMI